MIYKLEFDRLRFQSVFTTLDFTSPRFNQIRRRWDQLEEPGSRFHMTGLGLAVEDSVIRQNLFKLFTDYPSEMELGEPPREPADIVLDFHPPYLAFSSKLEFNLPELFEHISKEGVLVDYPYEFSTERLRQWLSSAETLKKWPQLSKVGSRSIVIEEHGSRELVCDPSLLAGYRIKVFCCTNWQHDLVDRELTRGEWHTQDSPDGFVKYFKVDPGAKFVVFKTIPARGTWLFRIPESTSPVFCTEEFRVLCNTHKLNGLTFKPMALTESYKPCPPPTVQNVPGWTGLDYKGPNPSFGRKGRAAE